MHFFVNGNFFAEEKASISAKDRGLLLGDGIFETIRAENAVLLFFEQHYERLKQSAIYLGIPIPYDAKQLQALCLKLIHINQLDSKCCAVRITLTRGINERGIDIPQHPASPSILISSSPYTPPTHLPKLTISEIRRNHMSPVTTMKTLHYLEPVLCRRAAKDEGFDDGIMLNTEDIVAETSTANLFLVKDSVVYTPSIESGVLPGIVRAEIIKICNSLHIPVKQEKITRQFLTDADEVFQTNSLIGVQPISCIDEKVFTYNNFSLVTKLAAAYNEAVISQVESLQVSPPSKSTTLRSAL